jgi:truncated hemoglobin YjbI
MEDLVKARKVGMDLYKWWVEVRELAENHPDPVVREKLNGFLEAFDEWMKFMDEKVSKIDNLSEDVKILKSDVKALKLKVL